MSHENRDNTDIVAAILTFAIEYRRLEPPTVVDEAAISTVMKTYGEIHQQLSVSAKTE